jgi:KaiC domain protein
VSDEPENWFEEDFRSDSGSEPVEASFDEEDVSASDTVSEGVPFEEADDTEQEAEVTDEDDVAMSDADAEDGQSEQSDTPEDTEHDRGPDPTAWADSPSDDGDDPFAGDGGGGDPFAGGGSDPFGGGGNPFGGGADPFGGGGSDPFGGGGGDPFGNGDFESAFDSRMNSTDFGEEFDSELPRIDVGIEGLDEMVQGGIPDRSLLVTIGAAGTGKTTFGLQFLQEGLQNDEKGVFITLEQDESAVLETAEEMGWPFEQYAEEESLAVVDLDPIEMANSLASIRSDLPRLVQEFGAERLVLDSVSLLEMMYDRQAERRTEVFDFTKSLKQAGVTTMLTSEASETNPYNSRHGIIEYLTDGVFVLQYVRSEFRETRLAVEIQKIRNANHSRETKPYEITGNGISVYQEASIF